MSRIPTLEINHTYPAGLGIGYEGGKKSKTFCGFICASLCLCPTQQPSLMGVGESHRVRVKPVARWGNWNVRMLYVFVIGNVAAMLFVAVNKIEPNRHYALALKLLIVFVSAAG